VIEVTEELVIEKLEEIIAEYGADYVYERVSCPENDWTACVYVHHGEPSCLVGHFVSRIGLDVTALDGCTETSYWMADYFRTDQVMFTISALDALREAQIEQDCGKTWGEALEGAHRLTRLGSSENVKALGPIEDLVTNGEDDD
jgi:hypothetical protein